MAKKRPATPDESALGEYVRKLQQDNQTYEGQTVEDLIKGVDYCLDVEGVDSDREERRLERLRARLKTVPAGTTVEAMSEWI